MPDPSTNGEQANIVHAEPSKAFFIDMLTRDIGVTDCILDLVDNAVDKAVELTGLDVMSILKDGRANIRLRDRAIDINFSADRFAISDTCGGIAIEEARERVFLFGNPDEHGADAGLSVYGIGMKRAFFKLGRNVKMISTFDSQHFELSIDVDKWKKTPVWEFQFSAVDPHHRSKTKTRGTDIEVTHLRLPIRERLNQKTFETELRSRISRTYALFIRAGLKVRVNGRLVEASLPELATRGLTPARRSFETSGVTILIIAGLTPSEDSTPQGWYIFCNGRMVLAADKTTVTGWGDDYPQWHSKYNHFVGFVYFRASDVRKLPWRTTKEGVEKESAVYEKALNEMKLEARPILNALNSLYSQDETADVKNMLQGTVGVTLDKLPRAEASFEIGPARRAKSDVIKIQYGRPRRVVEKIRRHLGDDKLSGTKIGELTFDYYVDQELG
jgi:hypothetical protein